MLISNRHTRPRRCAWPSQVDLPQGQTSMSDDDWVRYIESCLRSANAMSGIDRAMFSSARHSLLALRRYHLASAGMQARRWVASREGSVHHG